MSFRKAFIDMDKGEPFECFELNFYVFNVRFSFCLFQMLNQKCVFFGALHLVSKKSLCDRFSIAYAAILEAVKANESFSHSIERLEKCQCSK